MEKLHRIEKDFLGEKEIELDKYYGVQTLRAKENFNITTLGISIFPTFIIALAKVKKACALTNYELGDLTDIQKNAIVKACDRIIAGEFHDQFIVDPIQGGAGTSTNMNANEVIANVALEILGYPKSSYDIIHPNNHINMSQSTNDVYPTAIKIALYELIFKLQDSLKILRDSFHDKAVEFKDILKMGRTQLQDAVPMTLGQEFKTYATMIDDDIFRLSRAQDMLKEVNLGATAIGTGINTKPEYQELVIKNLRIVTGTEYYKANDMIEATQDTGSFVQISGRFKSIAIKVSKICNDLRLLSSGPRAGLNEINLPPMQPGSSIMPGKVNPTQSEAMTMVAVQVMGNHSTISIAASQGNFELNVFKPVIALNLLQSIRLLSDTMLAFNDNCAVGIEPNMANINKYLNDSLMLVTALNPYIGYEKAALIAKTAHKNGTTLKQEAINLGILSEEEFNSYVKPENMIKPSL